MEDKQQPFSSSISDDVRNRNYLVTEATIATGRWFVIAFLFLYINILKLPGWPVGLFNLLILVAALYNLGITLAVRRTEVFSVKLTLLFLYCDMTAVSVGLYFTGGSQSPFLFLWYLTLFTSGVRFGYLRSLAVQVPLALFYTWMLQREMGIRDLESINRLVFGLFAIAAAALYGALFSREERYTFKRLSDVHREAITDRLTGLYNYAYFLEALKREKDRADRSGGHFSLAIFDLDHFKGVNDTYGHEKGNQLLRAVANILKASSRKVDTVARYGGEEFMVLMPDSNGSEMEVAERIRTQIENAEFPGIAEGPLKITISAGICSYPKEASTVMELLDRADQGLYRAKNSGRNRACNCSEGT